MRSMEESRRQVKENLGNAAGGPDHDAILASLQDEIDRHNAVKDGLRSSMHSSPWHEARGRAERRSMKFRFKSGAEDERQRRKRRERQIGRESHHKRSRHHEDYPTPPQEPAQAEEATVPAHPFLREPTTCETARPGDSNQAFRTSLFDALADDEGAAYWETVYSQPIHVYPRPSVRTAQGELEAMSDAEYADYVKTKMWERKHPEVVQERKRKDKESKLEEEERSRRREEFVRRRERAAWERTQGWKSREDEDESANAGGARKTKSEYEFAGDVNRAPGERGRVQREYAEAWAKYLSAWDQLKYDLLAERSDPADSVTFPAPSKRIPWPVLAGKPVIKSNIETFMHHAPSDAQHSKFQLLKMERVRWHPDKVQQRFAGAVDEGMMKVVTGVFQVVDGLLEEEKKRSESR